MQRLLEKPATTQAEREITRTREKTVLRELTGTATTTKTAILQRPRLITRTVPREITLERPREITEEPPPTRITLPKRKGGFLKYKKKKSELFRTLVKRRGKWLPFGKPTTRPQALLRGQKIALETLAASFKAEPTGQYIESDTELGGFKATPAFRAYKIRHGARIPLVDEFIQRRGKRLAAKSEVREIQLARAGAQNVGLTPERKSFKMIF